MSSLATKQPFETEAAQPKTELVQRLSSLSRSVRQLLNIKLAPLGLIAGQDQFLMMLLENGTVSSIKAANALGVRPSTISKMVDILERHGWTQRSSDDGDHRLVLVSLTKEGTAIAQKAKEVMAEMEKEVVPFCEDVERLHAAAVEMEAILAKRLSRLR